VVTEAEASRHSSDSIKGSLGRVTTSSSPVTMSQTPSTSLPKYLVRFTRLSSYPKTSPAAASLVSKHAASACCLPPYSTALFFLAGLLHELAQAVQNAGRLHRRGFGHGRQHGARGD
jgi:hypothetical protein